MKTNPSTGISNHEEIWLDNHDLIKMLPISARTLQRWRSNNILTYYKVKGKYYIRNRRL